MFENATRKQYRYPSVRGDLSTEQLWQLPLVSKTGFDLDSVAKAVNQELKAMTEESFVEVRDNAHKTQLQEQLEILKHIIKVKQDEKAARESAIERSQQRARLTEILHIRSQQDLMSKTPEEIQAMIDAL